MHILVLGLRGFPGVQGGVETHAEHLYPRLRDMGCDVEVVVRSPYWRGAAARGVPGIRFHPIWCPRATGAEAFVHSFLGVLYAGWRRPDVLHIHAIGPALFTPLAKLLGLRVVVTHHGPDYDREKWSPLAKAVLRAGERLGMRYADARIVISGVIGDLVRRKHGRDSDCIPNGVEIPPPSSDSGEDLTRLAAEFGLAPGRYILNVSRLVPEKRHLDLIEAFRQARAAGDLDGWKLALVGALDGSRSYVQQVIAAAERCPDVVLTGFQTGQRLNDLYANAGLFVLPSTHEGLPIALLEALSHGLPAIASDIPANLEVGLAPEQYFRVGDAADLRVCLHRLASRKLPPGRPSEVREWVRQKYDWQPVARSTLGVYERVARRRGAGSQPVKAAVPPD